MANTSFLRYAVEPWVREQLGREFGQLFLPRVVRLEPGGEHEFDAVSGDSQIVGSIKASSGLTSGGNHPTGKVSACLNEIYFLSLVSATTRLLILTNAEFHEIFLRKTEGKIVPGIDVRLIELPVSIQQEVDRVVSSASDEMNGNRKAVAMAIDLEEGGERGEDT